LDLILEVYGQGSNSVWEHILVDTTVTPRKHRKKPQPQDPLSVKEDFIRQKYSQLAFINKTEDTDLSQQLHSAVRTTSLKVSLRLLTSGGDVNFVSKEKGSTTPLHVAVMSNQRLQVELLLVFGADPLIRDANGRTALDCSMDKEMQERLMSAPFVVQERLLAFVGRQAGQQETNPLESLSDRVFEELAKDVYDEVDRRETNQAMSSVKAMTPFLPVNPVLSSTRNQGRQKLATLIRHEFNSLVLDVLKECQRRMNEQETVI